MARSALTVLKQKLTKQVPGSRFQADWFLKEELPPRLARALLKSATFQEGSGARRVRGQRGQCHANAVLMVLKYGWQWYFGLALSGGCWRVHSWCINTCQRVVETTEPRELYWGAPMEKVALP